MVRQRGQSIRILVAASLALCVMAAESRAQGVGFQGGVSVDPEQFYVGSHFESRALVDRLHFRPGIEGGFGDGLKLAAVNIEILYKFPLPGSVWTLYQGTGPAVNFYRIDDQTDIRGGWTAAFGFAHVNGFFAEFKAGGIGSPSLKFAVGFTLRERQTARP